jgi:hypothetical protein
MIYKDEKRTLERHDRETYKYIDKNKGAIFYFNAINIDGYFLEFRRLRSSSGYLAGVINKLDELPRQLLNEFERIERGDDGSDSTAQ